MSRSIPSPVKVSCPECGRPVLWSAEASPWRPFCSERCRLLDLGAWVAGDRAIPGDEPAPGSGEDEGPAGTG